MVSVDDTTVITEICDTAGQVEFLALRDGYYAVGTLFVPLVRDLKGFS